MLGEEKEERHYIRAEDSVDLTARKFLERIDKNLRKFIVFYASLRGCRNKERIGEFIEIWGDGFDGCFEAIGSIEFETL